MDAKSENTGSGQRGASGTSFAFSSQGSGPEVAIWKAAVVRKMSDEAPQLSAKPRQGRSAVFVFHFHMKGAKWPMEGEGAAGVFGASTASRVATPPPASKLSGGGCGTMRGSRNIAGKMPKKLRWERERRKREWRRVHPWESGCGVFCCVYLRKSAIEGRNDSYIYHRKGCRRKWVWDVGHEKKKKFSEKK